ncbi:proteasome assembly chaperone family protein [Desulfurococcus mucosus]|uniref:ATP-grasp superfamily protein n=1 Tax=Desulfurococcus mucosus (strain ATCC 35584 / DSM 2162 / JCM 9187 / O7/1) TaxID=765177 RepID=E8R780_DESM0|nr:PAC2 family protein [Desulfurococcus mucosus]ADV65545.1 ATP-grasp superfamily protein [Desulfurococcus mucosus DSM 2162]
MISFIKTGSIDLRELEAPYLVTGYQGFGMVGYLTTRHIVRELKLQKAGFIKTRYMPEFTLYSRDRGLVYPFEVYAGRAGGSNIVVVLHNATPAERERTMYAEYLASLARDLGVKEVILVGGLDPSIREDEKEKYRWIPIGDTGIRLDAKLLEDRHVIGPLALTMVFMNAYGLKGVTILSYTELYRPDPKASAVAVEVVGDILGVKIDTSSLLEEASIIEAIEAEREKVEKAIEESERKSRLSYI